MKNYMLLLVFVAGCDSVLSPDGDATAVYEGNYSGVFTDNVGHPVGDPPATITCTHNYNLTGKIIISLFDKPAADGSIGNIQISGNETETTVTPSNCPRTGDRITDMSEPITGTQVNLIADQINNDGRPGINRFAFSGRADNGRNPITGTVTFGRESGSGVSSGAPINVTLPFKRELSDLQLFLSVGGTGTGTITASPKSDGYTDGAKVTVTATPAAGSIFTGWEGDCREQFVNPCSLVMHEYQRVTAVFHTLTLTTIGSGSGTLNATSSGISAAGASVSVTPVPVAGSVFTGWRGEACKDIVLTCTFQMTFAKAVTGIFVPSTGIRQYDGEYAGTVPSPAGPTPIEFTVNDGAVAGRWVGPPGAFTGSVSASGAFTAHIGPLDGGCTVDLTGQVSTSGANGITAASVSGQYKKNQGPSCGGQEPAPYSGTWSASRNMVQTKSFF